MNQETGFVARCSSFIEQNFRTVAGSNTHGNVLAALFHAELRLVGGSPMATKRPTFRGATRFGRGLDFPPGSRGLVGLVRWVKKLFAGGDTLV